MNNVSDIAAAINDHIAAGHKQFKLNKHFHIALSMFGDESKLGCTIESPFTFENKAGEQFRISIQASAHHYSIPRKFGYDKYDNVEIGFPNWDIKHPDIIKRKENHIIDIYGYVDVGDLAQEIYNRINE